MVRQRPAASNGHRRSDRMRRSPDDKRRQRRAGRAFVPEQAPTIERVLQLLVAAAPERGRWLSLGLALLTIPMLQLWRGAGSGNGWLPLCAPSRTPAPHATEQGR